MGDSSMEFYGFDLDWECEDFTTTTTTTTNFAQRMMAWQENVGYNLETLEGSCGYLLQISLEALQDLYDGDCIFKDLKLKDRLLKTWSGRLTHMFNSIPLRVKFAEEEMTKKYRSSKAGGKQRKCQEMRKPIPIMVMQDIYDLGTEVQQN